MQFLYNENAGSEYIELQGEDFNYIFKIRRTIKSNILFFRNMKDNTLYEYHLIDKTKKIARYKLETLKKENQKKKKLHLAISIIDIKDMEKMLPFLNELEVSEISFVYAKYSQRNIKISLDRIKKILINSSQQCGRNNLIRINQFDSIKEFLEKYPSSYILHFHQAPFQQKSKQIDTILIGPEGGFSDEEVELFDNNKKVGLNTSSILKTTTSCISIASLISLRLDN